MLRRLLIIFMLPIALASCQIKGMYVSKNSNVPLPMNVSMLKKSELDEQAVQGPGYTYYARTVNGDETIIPAAGISAWKWVRIFDRMVDGFDTWDANQTTAEIAKDTNATQIASEQIAADVTKATFIPPE